MNQKIIVFDTTLRDGEQALQASLNVKEKLQIALALERLGVDIIEIGFPASSPGDFESAKIISRKITKSCVCGLARCVEKDITTAYSALKKARNFRIHIFIATSPIHIVTKLRTNLKEIVSRIIKMVKLARNYTNDVQFSCEDSGRTPINDLCYVVEAAIKAGANTINIPDTVGYTFPNEYSNIITQLLNKVPNISKSILSIHTHDDLGMAVGNAINAIQAGARQVEGTINGLGERAGNCALEEIIMAIKTRESFFKLSTNVNLSEIYKTSQIVSQICNMPIPSNKAIVGANAFSHSSGIHQDGVIKNRENYEIVAPESIGFHKIQLNLTSRSGRAAVKHRMEAMGYTEEVDYNLDKLYEAFLKLADKKGQIFDYDLEALAFINKQNEDLEFYQLKKFEIHSGSIVQSKALVTLLCGNNLISKSATGNGPVDAIYHAINRITKLNTNLLTYKLIAKGHGKNALGQADIVVDYRNRKFHGIGLDTDIVESSTKAIINALNNIWRAKEVEKELQKKFIKNK
ncbi:2-isopropylmalate synthase [Candidatus Tachikawaea gelatinosa]|uniref:2-isopropylmalate synthase n=1 Tax=Candidatus Tachikawaea gelatinosa TaxID=1410383 RepID=A0A090ARP1_9ENTR|nr:2-isopropylmalate synthase [Candidatus Tachikawaea gelatinosa]BAP58470.1 2-isopropylmalate synthase [Candidatus Tachikawaea gelatinosa]